MIHAVQIPDSIALVIQRYGFPGQIIRQIFFKNFVDLAIGIFKNHIRRRIHSFYIALVHIQLIPHSVAAIKNDHLRLADHFRQKRTHICIVHGECRTVNGSDLLFNLPIPGQLHVFIIPHSVKFNDNPFRFMLLFQAGQIFRVEILLVLNPLNLCPASFQKLTVIFLLTLLTENQKRLSLHLKIGLCQCKADKLCLSALQKTIDHIYGFHPYLLPEKLLQLIFLQFRSNDAEFAGHLRLAGSDIMLLRYIIKIYPCAVLSGNHPLGPQYHAIFTAVQSRQDILNLLPCK